MSCALRKRLLVGILTVVWGTGAGSARAADEPPRAQEMSGSEEPVEVIHVVGRQPVTATSIQTVPAQAFELRPLESAGQMLEAVPNLLTGQHTGGGKAEQYFIRGFDADHGTDLAVYFDGVPVNLRSHAHGQGFLDLHFITPETIEQLDAYKGTYFTQFGDFSTAGTVEYVPRDSFPESLARVEYGQFDTFRTVAIVSPSLAGVDPAGAARGFVSFEAYHTNGPFENPEDLWRYSALARGEIDISPRLSLSGHVLGYHADWNASGLIPEELVDNGTISRFGSLDPTEGGNTTRAQAKLQLDWYPTPSSHLMANAYVSYYDFELFSNFTYFLNDPINGDGIVQRDQGRIYTGGRFEYLENPAAPFPLQLRAGLETRYDDASVFLGTQTRRTITGVTSNDAIQQLSLEPYVDFEIEPLPWLRFQSGLRVAWFHFTGTNELTSDPLNAENATRWLPKANLNLSPFSDLGPLPVDVEGIRNLQLLINFGIGYHSNDARALFSENNGNALPRATGVEVGLRTAFHDYIDIALDGWSLNLEDELVFAGDEGTTESVGETNRLGVEFAMTARPVEWWYVAGDVAYTSVRFKDGTPVPQAPRFVAKAATGVRYKQFSAEFNARHLGARYASQDFNNPKIPGYTVLDLGLRYRWRFLEVGLAIENLANTLWSSSEFFYESRPTPTGPASEDFHFSPGNPRNVRAWISGYF